MLRHIVQRLGHVFDTEIGHPDIGNVIGFFHHFGQISHGPGALNNIQRSPVRPLNIRHPPVAGHHRHHLNTHPLIIVLDDPSLSTDIELTQDVDAGLSDIIGLSLPDQFEKCLAGCLVAIFFGSLESFRIDG